MRRNRQERELGAVALWGLVSLLLLASACRSLTPSSADVAKAANGEIRHGELSRALTLTEQGLEKQADPESLDAWRLRLLRAEVLLLLRRSGEVGPVLDARLPDGAAFSALRAKQSYLRAQRRMLEGDLNDAQAMLGAAEREARAAGDGDLVLDAQALRGQAEMRLGRDDQGQATLRHLASESKSRGDEYHLALAVINTGMGYLVRDRFDEALPYFEQATRLSTLPTRIRAAALTNAGLCYTRLGDFDRALTMQRQAVEAHEHGAPVFLEQALGELGNTYLMKGDYAAGGQQLTRALRVALDNGQTRDAQTWARNLAWASVRLGHWDEAERFSRQSRSLQRTSDEGASYDTLNDAEIAAGRGDLPRARQLYSHALRENATDPFVTSEAYAGVARLDVAEKQPARAAAGFERALGIIERSQEQLLKTDYKLTYLARVAAVYEQYIDMLVDQGQIARALEVADSSHARVLASRHGEAPADRVSARRLQRVAEQSGAVLLTYSLGERRSHGWAVTARAVQHLALPPAGEIESLVHEHQQAIVDSLADPVRSQRSRGERLYELLVQPFSTLLRPGARVVISPSGALSRLNFETLPVAGPERHYWIADVEVTVAPALGMLAAPPPRAAASKRGVLIVGDPAAADPAFPPLKYAPAEIGSVAAAFPQATIYRGADASPLVFRRAQPERFSLIHFAAHATANRESPLDSAVVLARDASGYKLYARDVADEPLAADLVTISACRGAGERAYAGEGLVGFAWAFLHAGARRVLAGLWDVDDRSTSLLMDGVYRDLARGVPPGTAVRSAKLALIARGGTLAKPYYWGPFELITATPEE